MPLIEAIWDARSKWRYIGLKLGLTYGDIHAIEDGNKNCLTEVLVQWMQTGKATIYEMLKALESAVICRSDIANTIRSRQGEERKEVGLPEEISGK